jgi:DNA repair exonuclease SbcCD ATPase subunit
MLPIELDIENFYCHGKSVIKFDEFNAAVIVARINGNDKLSNGAGKSSIFAAIKYVLFNEVDTTSLEKVIKHDAEFCRVIFTFLSSLDDQVYKIIRFRGRKPGAEVRLFRKSGDNWDDLTQRTSTETEKEILKLLKINYRTFSNSVLFAQGDVAGIAAMTPRERKVALKEALQLGVYSKYEGLIKKKILELTKDVEKSQTILTTLGEPAKDIENLKGKTLRLIPIQASFEKDLKEVDKNINSISKEASEHNSLLEGLADKISQIDKANYEVDRDISSLKQDISKYSNKILELKNRENSSLEKGKELFKQLKALKSVELPLEGEANESIGLIRSKLVEAQSDFKQLLSKLKDLQIPLTNDAVCKHCRQPADEEARKACQISIDKEIKETESRLTKTKVQAEALQIEVQKLEKQKETITKTKFLLQSKEHELDQEKKELLSFSSLSKELNTINEEKNKSLAEKLILKKDLEVKQNNSSLNEQAAKIKSDLNKLKIEFEKFRGRKTELSENISKISNEQAVIDHTIKQKENDAIKINLIKSNLKDLEHQFVLHQKVMTAFGPSGIPALITHNILDDYQIEANTILDQLRPGLRLQFLTEKDKKDKDDEAMADTLEITYFLNNTELEYSQLSGAQKLLVSLALRLGLAGIIRKRLGIDLKMILIDEADQSLDEGALETFEQAIKQLQKDYKILIITHNMQLKMKFPHAIVIDQDNQLNSTARVTHGW